MLREMHVCEQESIPSKRQHTILRREGETTFWLECFENCATLKFGIEANFIGVKQPAEVKRKHYKNQKAVF